MEGKLRNVVQAYVDAQKLDDLCVFEAIQKPNSFFLLIRVAIVAVWC